MRIDAFAMNVTSRLKNKKSVNLKKKIYYGGELKKLKVKNQKLVLP